MINGKRVITIIPARAGSKSIKFKNLKELGGKPILVWSIESALATPEIDRVIVSTDGENIAEAARQAGAEVAMRPDELSTDTAIPADMIRHHIAELRREGDDFTYLVYLEPTSPFRRVSDIQNCLQLMDKDGLDSVATFMDAMLNPHRAWTIDDSHHPSVFIDGAVPWLPRQKLPKAYQLNGAVYAFIADKFGPDAVGLLFGKQGAIVMPPEYSVDLDEPFDFVVAEAMLSGGLLSPTS